MKRIASFLFLLAATVNGFAQGNLVENASFEDYSSCPVGQCKIHRAVGWSSFGFTPDYFHSCNSGNWSVPNNAFGYQNAATGNAYAAYGFYAPDFLPDQREYVGTQLSAPLIIGQKYQVSFKVVSADVVSIRCYVNKLGVLFTSTSYALDTNCTNTTLLNPFNFAHLFTDSIITDTANWTTISGTFTADSAYQYIIIGNFFDDANTNFIQTDTTIPCQAAYLVDDVFVGMDSVNAIDGYNQDNTITIFPNPVTPTSALNIKSTSLFSYMLYDVLGKIIIPESEKIYNSNVEIDTGSLSRGIYLIKLRTDIETAIRKLIVVNP